MATDPQSLLNSAACYNNFSAQFQLMKLGLLRLIVLNQNPMAATDPQSLLNSANCMNCYGPGAWPLLELALLQLIANGGGTGGGGTTTLYGAFGGIAPAATGTATGQLAIDSGTGQGWVWNGTYWVALF